MAQTFGGGSREPLARRIARTNWWLIGAIVVGLAFWVAVITAGRAFVT